MLKEFKDFVSKGNMLDLAIGVVIGAAFGKVTEGFMNFIVNPVIGLVGGTDFSNLFAVLKEGKTPGPYNSLKAAQDAGASALAYGAFLSTFINFLIVAFVMFMVIKAYNRFKKGEADAVLVTSPDTELLTEIRDLLAKK